VLLAYCDALLPQPTNRPIDLQANEKIMAMNLELIEANSKLQAHNRKLFSRAVDMLIPPK
jgi:hypothetical protein